MTQEYFPPPAISPTIEDVRNRFETWRARRKTRSRIPKSLWQAAVELCEMHSAYEVSRTLRLNLNDLKSQIALKKAASLATGRSTEFVEVDLRQPLSGSECTLEMEAANGAKMKMHLRGDWDPLQMARIFWRQGL
jgi:hypothetical protein